MDAVGDGSRANGNGNGNGVVKAWSGLLGNGNGVNGVNGAGQPRKLPSKISQVW